MSQNVDVNTLSSAAGGAAKRKAPLSVTLPETSASANDLAPLSSSQVDVGTPYPPCQLTSPSGAEQKANGVSSPSSNESALINILIHQQAGKRQAAAGWPTAQPAQLPHAQLQLQPEHQWPAKPQGSSAGVPTSNATNVHAPDASGAASQCMTSARPAQLCVAAQQAPQAAAQVTDTAGGEGAAYVGAAPAAPYALGNGGASDSNEGAAAATAAGGKQPDQPCSAANADASDSAPGPALVAAHPSSTFVETGQPGSTATNPTSAAPGTAFAAVNDGSHVAKQSAGGQPGRTASEEAPAEAPRPAKRPRRASRAASSLQDDYVYEFPSRLRRNGPVVSRTHTTGVSPGGSDAAEQPAAKRSRLGSGANRLSNPAKPRCVQATPAPAQPAHTAFPAVLVPSSPSTLADGMAPTLLAASAALATSLVVAAQPGSVPTALPVAAGGLMAGAPPSPLPMQSSGLAGAAAAPRSFPVPPAWVMPTSTAGSRSLPAPLAGPASAAAGHPRPASAHLAGAPSPAPMSSLAAAAAAAAAAAGAAGHHSATAVRVSRPGPHTEVRAGHQHAAHPRTMGHPGGAKAPPSAGVAGEAAAQQPHKQPCQQPAAQQGMQAGPPQQPQPSGGPPVADDDRGRPLLLSPRRKRRTARKPRKAPAPNSQWRSPLGEPGDPKLAGRWREDPELQQESGLGRLAGAMQMWRRTNVPTEPRESLFEGLQIVLLAFRHLAEGLSKDTARRLAALQGLDQLGLRVEEISAILPHLLPGTLTTPQLQSAALKLLDAARWILHRNLPTLLAELPRAESLFVVTPPMEDAQVRGILQRPADQAARNSQQQQAKREQGREAGTGSARSGKQQLLPSPSSASDLSASSASDSEDMDARSEAKYRKMGFSDRLAEAFTPDANTLQSLGSPVLRVLADKLNMAARHGAVELRHLAHTLCSAFGCLWATLDAVQGQETRRQERVDGSLSGQERAALTLVMAHDIKASAAGLSATAMEVIQALQPCVQALFDSINTSQRPENASA